MFAGCAPNRLAADSGCQGAVPNIVGDGIQGQEMIEHLPQPVWEQASTNMILAREEANLVPGRFDNLPKLNSVYGYSNTNSEITPADWGDYDYQGLRKGDSFLQTQYNVLTPQETPLSYGILPKVGKGTGTQLPDPISGADLKPQKHENLDVDMFVAAGDSLPSRFDFNPIQTGMAQKRARQADKFTSGHGAMDYYTHINDEPCTNDNALFGFAQGEVMTPRYGGFHPRERFFRVPETKRGRNQHAERFTNPTKATWHQGSIYQTGTAPLGELRLNRNADVREYYRAPERTSGISNKISAQNEFVDMPFQNRDVGDPGLRKRLHEERKQAACGFTGRKEARQYDPDDLDFAACDRSDPTTLGTERSWTSAPNRLGTDQELRREEDLYVRPKNVRDFQLRMFGSAAHESQVGSYIYSDYSSDLCDRMTNRTLLDDKVMHAPAPNGGRRGEAGVYSQNNFFRNGFDKTITGRAAAPVRSENMTADGMSGQRFQETHLRSTLKEDPKILASAGLHAPVGDRQLAMQYSQSFACPVTRRVQPTVVNSIDFDGATPYMQNPYTQPLPFPANFTPTQNAQPCTN
jgi:hypothetical protein